MSIFRADLTAFSINSLWFGSRQLWDYATMLIVCCALWNKTSRLGKMGCYRSFPERRWPTWGQGAEHRGIYLRKILTQINHVKRRAANSSQKDSWAYSGKLQLSFYIVGFFSVTLDEQERCRSPPSDFDFHVTSITIGGNEWQKSTYGTTILTIRRISS